MKEGVSCHKQSIRIVSLFVLCTIVKIRKKQTSIKIKMFQISAFYCRRAELLILIWMASLAFLATVLLSWSIILKWEMLPQIVVANAVFVNGTGDMTILFFLLYFPNTS